LIVNLRSPATDTFADGRVRARARANSWVKAGGVSISAQIAAQMATTENSTPNNGRIPRPHSCLMLAISGTMKLENGASPPQWRIGT
jgi:hypothetical protein